jgi:uncharacterized RDD family membrane protein YckC
MKKFVVFLAVFFFALSGPLRADQPRDVLAHSCGDWIWFAHVTRVRATVAVDPSAPGEQTELFALQNAPGQQWRSLGTVPGRAVALAARSSQLAVLISDGNWLTIWSDGSATGQALPAGGIIRAFADDGTSLWAIGAVNGGIAAADRAISEQAAATQPTTSFSPQIQPIDAAPVDAHAGHPVRSIPAKMVLFHEVDGRWATVAEMAPDAILTPDEQLSLAVVGGQPLVSIKTDDGKVRTQRYTPQHTWVEAGWPSVSAGQSISNFALLSDGFKPYLWWTTGNAAGDLLPDASGQSKRVQLQWSGNAQLDGLPACVFAGGYFCVFGPHAEKVYEQRFKSDGSPVAVAAEITTVSDSAESLLPRWLQIVFLTSMGFSVGASVFRNWNEPERTREMDNPVPAPLFPRFTAGIIDALPVLGALFYLGVKTDALSNMTQIPAMKYAVILGAAVIIYLLHTTLAEVFTGRSAGKWIFNLKVVTTEGNTPSRAQFLLRNLLRVIDPLITIIISPQGQRSADTVAGTMVISLDPPVEPQDDFDDQQ